MALKVWLVVGDSNTSVSVRMRARLPGPGHQNINSATRRERERERNHVRSAGEVGDGEGRAEKTFKRPKTVEERASMNRFAPALLSDFLSRFS